jgi:recombination associated protein RdgC
MFKNVRFLGFTGAWPGAEEELSAALAKASFTPCGPLTEITSGFEAPVNDGLERLCRRVGGADLMQLRTQSRLLPASAVNEALELRLAEYRERMGEAPGRREKRRLKAETRDQLLPKALLRSERIKGFFLQSESILGIDSLSPPKLERFLETLRLALGRLEVDDLAYERPVGEMLKRIFLGDAPPGIRLGRECRMQDAADSKSSVRWTDMDLSDASIRKHVRDGMTLTHLGIEFDGIMSAVLDERGGLSKLRLLGTDAKEVSDEEDPLARFDAEFVLLTGTLRRFLAVLGKALGGAGAGAH